MNILLTQESVDLLNLGQSVQTPRGFAFKSTLEAAERRIAITLGRPPFYYVCFPSGPEGKESRHCTAWEALQALARLG